MPDQAREIEWADCLDLFAYWREFPPVHEILKVVHEVKPAPTWEPSIANSNDPSGIGNLISLFPDGRVSAQRAS